MIRQERFLVLRTDGFPHWGTRASGTTLAKRVVALRSFSFKGHDGDGTGRYGPYPGSRDAISRAASPRTPVNPGVGDGLPSRRRRCTLLSFTMKPHTLPPTDPPPPDPRVVLGLGSNLGSRVALLHAAMDLLDATEGLRVTARSSVWETAPVGPPQPAYRNAAVCVASTLDLTGMLQATQAVEARLGRVRELHWGPRTLDIDILWAAPEHPADTTGDLVVPHPRLRERAFALGPLCEVFPDALDPATGEPYGDVLASLHDNVPDRALFPTATVTETLNPKGWNVTARAADRADLFAACADALGQVLAPGESVRARDITKVHCPLTPADDDDNRLLAWLSRVLTVLFIEGFALRRAVVLCDGPDGIDGLLVGEARGASQPSWRTGPFLDGVSVTHAPGEAWTARGAFRA